MDISDIVTVVLRLIEEQRRSASTGGLIRQGADLEELLRDTAVLIDEFRKSVEQILRLLNTAYPTASIHRKRMRPSPVDYVSANRRLFDIQSEMRIVTNRLKCRLTDVGQQELEKLTDVCLQIVDIEGMVGVEVATRAHIDIVPLDWPTCERICGSGGLAKLPFDTCDMDEYVLGECVYFNSLLLRLQNCKERLALAIESINYYRRRNAPTAERQPDTSTVNVLIAGEINDSRIQQGTIRSDDSPSMSIADADDVAKKPAGEEG